MGTPMREDVAVARSGSGELVSGGLLWPLAILFIVVGAVTAVGIPRSRGAELGVRAAILVWCATYAACSVIFATA